MVEKLWFLIPEMVLFVGAMAAVIMGLSPRRAVRDSLPLVVCGALLVAGVLTPFIYDGAIGTRLQGEVGLLMPALGKYVKVIVCVVGIVLALISAGLIDRRYESAIDLGRTTFQPLRANRGEFSCFFLLSLIGVMLCCNANDLIWLFLALELTSLPTYVMVAMSRPSPKAQEAAMKYFFLGALAAGMFLYGFALIYGATGTIVLSEIRDELARQQAAGSLSLVALVGLILAVLGVSYKIAAVPMHFYAPDVYEGAASPVTAFLGFVPKAAGMISLVMLLATVGWGVGPEQGLPAPIERLLWMIAVLTMLLGNVGALLQRSVKRMLAYSSIAHSGYMLIGVIAGPGLGINAMLFYLLVYGIMNSGAFAVLAGLERRGREIESMDDLAGLRQRYPAMAAVMAIAAGSLLGVPPLLGFLGKLYLFMAGVESGHVRLVIIAGINSAISAWYYLRIAGLPTLYKPTAQAETIVRSPAIWPRVAAVASSAALVILPIFAQPLLTASIEATRGYEPDIRLGMAATDAGMGEQPAIETPKRPNAETSKPR